jgi:hypothetical protein
MNPFPFQEAILKRILKRHSKTEFGKTHGFNQISSIEDYKSAIPILNYESIFPYIEETMDGKNNVLVNGQVDWFAKSSGTTGARSKYIPVTKSFLKNGHLKCAWDAASHIYNEDPQAKLFANKNLIMGGSLEPLEKGKTAGDISAIILYHFPKIGRRFYTPSFEISLMENWDEKIELMAQTTSEENVILLAGVPTWTLVLLKKILKHTGKKHIHEVWPNLRTYLHGGVNFEPYRKLFEELLPDSKLGFREVYNASEGYFALQNEKHKDGMLLLCDHAIYYEFIPKTEVHQTNPEAISLSEVELHKQYELVVTTTAGLYRYRMGDIIEFVDTRPYKIKHRGRVHDSINVYGEELHVSNTDAALGQLCSKYNIAIKDYTVAPKFMNKDQEGLHEWYIEFEKEPSCIETFQTELDTLLRHLNSDYDAKRSQSLVMRPLIIHSLPTGTFERYLRSINKYGGQNKMPRLKDDRSIVDKLINQASLVNHQ